MGAGGKVLVDREVKVVGRRLREGNVKGRRGGRGVGGVLLCNSCRYGPPPPS